jgi:hypothetical protein
MEPTRRASIYPSVDEINALPEKFRLYIHDLETRCDKSGDVQTIALLREDRDALQQRMEELEAQIDKTDDTLEAYRMRFRGRLISPTAGLCLGRQYTGIGCNEFNFLRQLPNQRQRFNADGRNPLD